MLIHYGTPSISAKAAGNCSFPVAEARMVTTLQSSRSSTNRSGIRASAFSNTLFTRQDETSFFTTEEYGATASVECAQDHFIPTKK